MPSSSLWVRRVAQALIGASPCLATPAFAQTEVCIESTSALYQAVADIDGSSTSAITLKLRAGTYTLSSNLVIRYRAEGDASGNYGKLTIRGGYNAGCTSHSTSQGATTLNGSGGQRLVDIELIDNALNVEYLTTNAIDWSVGNWIDYDEEPGTQRFGHVRFLDTLVSLSGDNYDVLIANSMFTARAGTPDDSVMRYHALRLDSQPLTLFAIANSTFRNGGLRIDYQPRDASQQPPFAQVQATSNVFENDGAEVVVANADLYARSNRFDSLSLSGGTFASNSGNINAPAQLGSGGVPANGSPVVNAGSRFVPGGLPARDLAGNPRLVGADPDMGAYETAVDNSFYLDVTNTLSSGAGSLAQAVASANSVNGRQVIRFNIAGSCPRVITLAQTLNLADEVDILGDTQPGSVANTISLGYNGTPCVILRAGNGVANGIVFNSTEVDDELKLGGIAFSGFTGDAVRLRSGRGHLLSGLQFGGSVAATPLVDVGTAIRVQDNATDAQIGGSDPAQRNLIGNASFGIVLDDIGGNQVLGNAIGDSIFEALPNSVGMFVYSPNNLIADNFVRHNASLGIVLSSEAAQHNTVRDNTIINNGVHGLMVSGGASRNRIGPGNYFAGNGGDGINLVEGSWNRLAGNTYSGNGDLAIDLGTTGVDANDPDPLFDWPGSANRGQNFPELSRARAWSLGSLRYLIANGELSSTLGSYRIEFHRSSTCDATGHGEGAVLLGAANVDLDCAIVGPDNQCRKSFELHILGDVPAGHFITATATSAAGHTSEFSACREVEDDRIFKDGFDPATP